MPSSDIGLVGLAVMGQNLALNIADHGFAISVFNRSAARMHEFVAANPDTPGRLTGCATMEEFAASLSRPRKAVILVKAGAATDSVIDALARVFEPGDIIIDGGNAHWLDTIRREKELKARGLRFVGCGVSGGEEGARFGPSLMPGGDYSAWQEIEPIWKSIAAKVDAQTGVELKGGAPGRPVQGGVPCAAYIGADGAGHYVKMVHNGIEYGDMQMICEGYDILRQVLGLSAAEIGVILQEWNSGILNSFLVEISAEVLRQVDPVTGKAFVDVVLDTAGNKGTGLWTSVSALESGVAAPTIGEAVFARYLSAVKEERVAASRILHGPAPAPYQGDKQGLINAVRDALYCAKICSYAQFSAARRGPKEVWLEAQLWRNCADFPRWLHHPCRFPAENHRSLWRRSRPEEPAARPLFQPQRAGRTGPLAHCDCVGGDARRAGAYAGLRLVVLRLLPQRSVAAKPVARTA